MRDPDNLDEWLYHELYIAYLKARRNKRMTKDEHLFELNYAENLRILKNDILNRTYETTPGITFVSYNPVIREIFAAPFRDRVVHHFLFNIVADWWDRRFIYDSYSCRVGKGTLFGIKRLEKHMRAVSDNYHHETYVIKLDLRGYFMSLPREQLYRRAVWGLDRQFKQKGDVYRICRFLWQQIIFDDPTIGVERRSDIKEWDKVPKTKSLFCQPPGQGIVIGNLTSQLLSNIYLDQLDRFICHNLGYKHYGRYVDDFYLVVRAEEYEQAKQDVKVIEDYLKTIGLTLHPNKRVFHEIHQGVPFLGAVVYPGHKIMDERLRYNFYQTFQEFMDGSATIDQAMSYFGHSEHINAERFIRSIFDDWSWEYQIVI